MTITPIRTRIFREGEDLLVFIERFVPRLPERSILVVTSKIVALAEGRTAVAESARAKARLIKQESEFAIRTKYVWLTIKDGEVMPTAGIDASNADGKLILLPRDSFHTAHVLRRALMKRFRLKKLGVLITDSRTLQFRAGVAGIALGYAGFSGLRNYRGTKDLFGRKLHYSRTDVADSLATAAVLEMGEGRERCPLALITDATVAFRDRIQRNELHIDPHDDLYAPLYRKRRI